MTAVVLRGDAAALPLPDGSVDLIVTSPPYFGLRSYSDGGAHYAGQVGDEATPGEYLDALTACTAEWVRVLKPGGSLFCNLGDRYAGGNGGGPPSASSTLRGNGHVGGGPKQQAGAGRSSGPPITGAPTKSLLGLPWRYAIRCVDQLGLILRAEIIWAKPNGLPESVTDRVRRSHEQVFHFVKQPRYYSAVDEVREPNSRHWERYSGRKGGVKSDPSRKDAVSLNVAEANPLGALPGSVWTIPTAPLQVPDYLGVDHFAAFPPELVKRIVAGWSPRQVCTVCGEGRRPVSEETGRLVSSTAAAELGGSVADHGTHPAGRQGGAVQRIRTATGYSLPKREQTVTGYACGCPDTTAPTTPGIVLDPFCGTGTTMLVASCLGRVGVGVEMSQDYCRLARWRTQDPGERARVLEVPKPEKPVEGQLGLFEGLGA